MPARTPSVPISDFSIVFSGSPWQTWRPYKKLALIDFLQASHLLRHCLCKPHRDIVTGDHMITAAQNRLELRLIQFRFSSCNHEVQSGWHPSSSSFSSSSSVTLYMLVLSVRTQPTTKIYTSSWFTSFNIPGDIEWDEKIHDQYLGGRSHYVRQSLKELVVFVNVRASGKIQTDQVNYYPFGMLGVIFYSRTASSGWYSANTLIFSTMVAYVTMAKINACTQYPGRCTQLYCNGESTSLRSGQFEAD